jgi:hypothetical protein
MDTYSKIFYELCTTYVDKTGWETIIRIFYKFYSFRKVKLYSSARIYSFTKHLYSLSINCELEIHSLTKLNWEQWKSISIQ